MRLVVTIIGSDIVVELDTSDAIDYWLKDKPTIADVIQEENRIRDLIEFLRWKEMIERNRIY